jgi:hypothetical protein
MPRPTYDEIASSYPLWQEHIDPNATTGRASFDAMSHDDRMALITETFGPEPERAPTVDEVLAETSAEVRAWLVEVAG